jgi:hypothetical protein
MASDCMARAADSCCETLPKSIAKASASAIRLKPMTAPQASILVMFHL